MKTLLYISLCLCCFSGYSQDKLAVFEPHALRFNDCNICPGFNYYEDSDEYSSFTNTYLKSNKSICMYAPLNTTDGNPETAWVEGVAGSGVGAAIVIPRLLDVNRPVEIWAGYGKSEALFQANNRPKKVLVTILKARIDWKGAHDMADCSDGYGSFQVVVSYTVVLEDFNGYQGLHLPDIVIEKYEDDPEEYHRMDGVEIDSYQERIREGIDPPIKKVFRDYAYFLKLEILEVYKGTKYDDTCISEVRN